ncbi:kinetochore protein fta7, partial [Colletotrichum sojae]
PPKAAEQQKKRGRPPASKAEDASAQSPGAGDVEPNEASNEATEAAKPSRRGRKPKRTEAAPETEPEPEPEPEPSPPAKEMNPKKRGRRREEATEETAAKDDAEPAQQKQQRKRTVEREQEQSKEQEASTTEKPPRGKPSRKPAKAANEVDGAEAHDAAKKKRGRPGNSADQPAEDQTQEQPEPKPTKKKRGRPSLSKEVAPEEPRPAEEEAQPKKRGRKPREKAPEAEEPAEEEATAEAAPERRGRQPAADEPSPEGAEAPAKKKRGRPSLEIQTETQEAYQPEKKGQRGRKAKQPSPVAEEAPADKPTKRRRKKPFQDEEEPQEPSPDSQSRRPGRRKATDAPQRPEEQSSQARKSKKRPSGDAPAEQPPSKKRRRTSDDQQQQQQQPRPQQQQQQQRPKPVPRTVPKHRHIASRIRRIPRSTIEEKWSPLAPSSVSLISNLLRLSERPVLSRLAKDEKRQDHAVSAIRLVANDITKKISRGLPFPPAAAPARGGAASKKRNEDAGRAEELDFERVVDGVASLERQLDPLLHAVQLLKAEQELEERALEEDYETLRTLEANARSEARNFKDSLRKTHVLVPDQKAAAPREVDDAEFEFVPGNVGGSLFEDLEDDELRGLAGQVGNHMESMRNNLRQIEGVVPQIGRTRAALQHVLFKHLDQQTYENVLFG